jgi:predicted GTPase
MWWLAIPIIGLVGKAVYDAINDEDIKPSPRRKTTLELSFVRLERELQSQKRYKVAILGQPGSGKSSLLKKMTNSKVKPLPIIGVQTDATDWSSDASCNLLSVYEDYAFADVPGYDTSSHPLNIFFSSFPFQHFDAFIFVIHGKLHSSDEDIFRLIAKHGKKICIAKSFSDSLQSGDIKPVEDDIRRRLSISNSNPILFFSNRTGEGIDFVFKSIQPDWAT